MINRIDKKNLYKHETLNYFYLSTQTFENQEGHLYWWYKKKIACNIFWAKEIINLFVKIRFWKLDEWKCNILSNILSLLNYIVIYDLFRDGLAGALSGRVAALVTSALFGLITIKLCLVYFDLGCPSGALYI